MINHKSRGEQLMAELDTLKRELVNSEIELARLAEDVEAYPALEVIREALEADIAKMRGTLAAIDNMVKAVWGKRYGVRH